MIDGNGEKQNGWDEDFRDLVSLLLDDVGTIPGDFQFERHHVQPQGVILDYLLALKFYTMQPAGEQIPSRLIGEVKEFVLDEVKNLRIDPHIGLGFAILSPGHINVARWDAAHPILLRNTVYSFGSDEEGKITASPYRNPCVEEGFCIWELGIVGHERDTWKAYLASARSADDKKLYLEQMMPATLL